MITIGDDLQPTGQIGQSTWRVPATRLVPSYPRQTVLLAYRWTHQQWAQHWSPTVFWAEADVDWAKVKRRPFVACVHRLYSSSVFVRGGSESIHLLAAVFSAEHEWTRAVFTPRDSWFSDAHSQGASIADNLPVPVAVIGERA